MRPRTVKYAVAGGAVAACLVAAAAATPTFAVSHDATPHATSDAAAGDDTAVPPGAGLVGNRVHTNAATATYTYVYGHQSVAADGASVTLGQAAPTLATTDYHSLAELAVQSADGRQIVEIGWTVDRAVNGDTAPHLFVFHWVNGQGSCYNGCGFVSTSDSVRAGDPVSAGKSGSYKIVHANGQWQTWYNGAEVGYFPDSLWSNGYTRAGLIQTFGEVASASASPCTDMGNGTFGHSSGSARIGNFALVKGASGAKLTLADSKSAYYDHGSATATGFAFGGPGAC